MQDAATIISSLQEELRKRDADLAAREREIQQLRAEVERLTKLVAELMEKLGQNSRNSSKPPSSDSPGDKPKRKNRGKGILVSDRAKALNFWAMERRQVCWAHLIRRFVSFSERDGTAGAMGRELLDAAGIMFSYWHDYRDRRLSREAFVHRMAPLRQRIEALLERAAAAGIDRMSGSCADILQHRAALFNFVDRRGVEPTNNHGERELRAFVLWRRRSFGAQSERGNTFAENIMTVVHTARKQQRAVLPLLTGYCEATWSGTQPPRLVSMS